MLEHPSTFNAASRAYERRTQARHTGGPLRFFNLRSFFFGTPFNFKSATPQTMRERILKCHLHASMHPDCSRFVNDTLTEYENDKLERLKRLMELERQRRAKYH